VESGETITFALGHSAMVVIVDAGDRPHGSGVRGFHEVVLHGPFPVPVADRLCAGDLPDRAVFGFVRLPQGCLPLGAMRILALRHERWDVPGATTGNPRECLLWFPESLSSELLDLVRPTPEESLPGVDWIDLLPRNRTGALHTFVTNWYAALSSGFAEPDTPTLVVPRLPAPLVDFYRTAAGRPQILGIQNTIFPPHDIRPYGDSGLVCFGSENVGVFQLLMDPTVADPPVLYDVLAGGRLVTEREPLSGYLLQFVLLEAAVQGPYGGSASLNQQQVQRFVSHLQPVPLRPLRIPADPTEFYVAPGLVAMISKCGDDWFELNVGSRCRSALRPMREPGFAWNIFNF